MLYSEEDTEKKDPKFEKLVFYFDRVQKTITQHHRTLDYLVRKVNKLIERKDKIERQQRGEIDEIDELPDMQKIEMLKPSKVNIKPIPPKTKTSKFAVHQREETGESFVSKYV